MNITRGYTLQEKEALHIIWNAAKEYKVLPPFMAFDEKKEADFYFNHVIGLALKWLKLEELELFFSSYEHHTNKQEMDDILWLAIENYCYKKEVKERPVLKELRKEYALAFFRKEENYGRYKMMVSRRSTMQQILHWASVIEKDVGYISKKERVLFQALDIKETLNAEEVFEELKDILIHYFHFSDFRMQVDRQKEASLWHKMTLKKERQYQDSLVVRRNINEDDLVTFSLGKEKHFSFSQTISEADEEYIRACLGKNIFSLQERKQIDQELCKDEHEYCALWFSYGDKDNEIAAHRDAQIVAEQAREQEEKNAAYVEKRKIQIEASRRKLSAQMDTLLSMYANPLFEKGRNGKLKSEAVYRLAILQDDRVFEKQSVEIQNNLVIDLLLDASSSRMRQQESIAAQAYTIAKSLVTCNIPVQVSAFRSLRGFTAIQILKKYDEQQCEKIFRYFASGFNRDGLALQALDKIINRDEKKHIIFVLTDASPLDSTKMPPEKGSIFLREYDGIAALEDTKEAVKLLREKGNYVAAIFTGSSTHLANAHTIYGHYFLRIQKVEQLADGLGELLHQALREIFD